MAEVETEGGTQGEEASGPPPPRRQDQRQESHKSTKSGAEMEEKKDEENDDQGDRERETPREAKVEITTWGGNCPPQRKMRIYLTLPQNVSTCCCGESIDTTRITTMGRTWTGELQTRLSDSVFGAG